jgi:ABC-type transport system substrate-binding protein
MNRRDRFAVAALFLALAIVGAVLVIPGPSAGPSPTARASGVTAPYREGVVGHPSSINPLTPRSQADQDLVALLFRGLVKAGPNGTVAPDLATWVGSTDGRSYTFTISDDAYWEDGQPVTAADVVFTVGLVQDAKYNGPVGASWQGVHATADGASIVHFTMTLPIAGFLRQAELPILPSHLLKGVTADKIADAPYSARPIGDGAYRIVDLDSLHALLERVPSVKLTPLPTPLPSRSATPAPSASALVFATATPKPPMVPLPSTSPSPTPTPTPTPSPMPTASPTAIPVPVPSGLDLTPVSQVELVFYSDAASATADFRAGKLDAVGGLSPEQTDAALTTVGARLMGYSWASLLSVVVNQRSDHPELRDASTRTGLLAAIDRNLIVTKVLEGRGGLADVPIPSWSPFYDASSVDPTPYGFLDARGYLLTAGWLSSTAGWTAPKGTTLYTLELLTPDEASSPVIYRTAVQVAAAWQGIGMAVQLEAVPIATYLDRLDKGEFATAVVDFEVGLDPDLEPMLLSSQVGSGGSNVAGLRDPTLDQMLMAARKAVDPVARQNAIASIEKYLSTTLPILPLAFRDYDLVVSNRVWDVQSNQIADPSGRFWDVIDWRLASGR